MHMQGSRHCRPTKHLCAHVQVTRKAYAPHVRSQCPSTGMAERPYVPVPSPLMARPHIYGRRPATVIGHSVCMYVHDCFDVYLWAGYAHALCFLYGNGFAMVWFG